MAGLADFALRRPGTRLTPGGTASFYQSPASHFAPVSPGRPAYSASRSGGYSALTAPAPAPRAPAAPGANGANGAMQQPQQATAQAATAFDPNTDPDVIAARAGGARDVADAEAFALQQRRSILTRLGDADLARAILGKNDPTLGAISGNADAMSTLGQIERAYLENQRGKENELNDGNLFYSTERGHQLGNLSQQRLLDRSGAEQDVQAQLTTIAHELLMARRAAADAIAAALRNASEHPPNGGGGGDGGGDGGDRNPDNGDNAILIAAIKRALAGDTGGGSGGRGGV